MNDNKSWLWEWLKARLERTPKKKERDRTLFVLRALLWAIGPLLSYLFLPIEGEFWSALMPEGNRARAYFGCFVLDVVGSILIYFFGRIQQTERKGSKRAKASWGIVCFAAAGVLASWFVSFQQMYSIRPAVYTIVHVLNAAIQPVMLLGIGYTQAVLGGKFESSTSEQPKSRKRKGTPTLAWWQSTYEQMNGERGQMTAKRVHELVAETWEQSISRSTAYNWRDDCKEWVQEVN